MQIVQARNVNDALATGIDYLLEHGVTEETRNGKCLVAPGPVCTVYAKPTERVLFSPSRDANPFFHLFESLWMLMGRDDVGFVANFAKRMETFSDDGRRMNGAYGYRWRQEFGFDQVKYLIAELKRNPKTRRAVMAMWKPELDLLGEPLQRELYRQKAEAGVRGGPNSKDLPCNTHVYFDVRGDKLNMTVCNRSNDIIWGCYGANAVHFSMLQEYMAALVGVPVGEYRQFSNNFHAYLDTYSVEKLKTIAAECDTWNLYANGEDVQPYPLVSRDENAWQHDLQAFTDDPAGSHAYRDPFFCDTVHPMYQAWAHRNNIHAAGTFIKQIKARDWKVAASAWLHKRAKKGEAA